jgi:chromosome segregation ATPase
MKLLGTSGESLQDPKAIQAELDRLEERDAELRSALEDIEHESRRCNDALERAGWHSSEVEGRRSLLAESREAIVADREELQATRRRLVRTWEHLRGIEHDD